ncbi:uracil-DNA glycosylase [Neptunicella marina]|uniref:Uracil-DNA glycosylase n=1 Tax=Neptunicella marina TaxID=2125989 RepID=A0A8J6IWL9_9ALTE|nr:uracil-DNA glycosylase [Neptunicella marina]MBC3767806.1 uracil-DNA glycosylase [Neptunicella marina]
MQWSDILGEEKQQDYFQQILHYVQQRRQGGVDVYPPADEVFSAFKSTPLDKVKVVILGQDPYHGPNQAHGLCFSVKPGIAPPPSLVNMYKELQTDIEGFQIPQHGYLQSWAEQGVLLLNTVLTVERGQAHSHSKIGWERFTDKVIEQLNAHTSGVVFILWGSHAQKKGRVIDPVRHHVLKGPHPSPLSAYRGFFGCKHFSTANQLLVEQGKTPINWQLPLTV